MFNEKLFLALIDDFLNNELSFELMEEFERALEEEFRREFFNTFKKTVELCHCVAQEEVPQELHVLVIQTICKTRQLSEAECDQIDCESTSQAAPAKPKTSKARKPRKKKRK